MRIFFLKHILGQEINLFRRKKQQETTYDIHKSKIVIVIEKKNVNKIIYFTTIFNVFATIGKLILN